ncbi:GNAT family N-acetyltransferase [Pseudomonas gingeri]|uniref:GNAT family N-acetyltransferase n=1 Tax=Pseudomonas gingeri TaxID=117681 RepID=UPI0015A005F4|nr:N-acetyltransferase [Pseudomonas gingeri]NWA01371.1 GNAT family N-acetyltransferase [Pseudomonas gingeri]NWA13826.1 GNAT family N-acetyltransferase [Pseudomonas gingeri]NWA52814.1 GNAT family N-acetyltransferase [Pseudomonas gingeri]NWA96311.1 GNAT family N-acetyltransferase [Pseudomonas gingeri]NWB00053.1 GNAT family N-acetyltransferase [Pseudomonas gingeri]
MYPEDVLPLTGTEALQQAGATLALAFDADPFMRWIYPRGHDYLRYAPQLFEAVAVDSLAAGGAHRTRDGAAIALWLPPGVVGDPAPIQAVLDRSISQDQQERIGAALGQTDLDRPDEPHWYLSTLGVDAALQGRGHGAILLKHGLRACDEQHLAAYLWSSNPKNIGFYQHHGFEITRQINAGQVPLLVTMLRPAR